MDEYRQLNDLQERLLALRAEVIARFGNAHPLVNKIDRATSADAIRSESGGIDAKRRLLEEAMLDAQEAFARTQPTVKDNHPHLRPGIEVPAAPGCSASPNEAWGVPDQGGGPNPSGGSSDAGLREP